MWQLLISVLMAIFSITYAQIEVAKAHATLSRLEIQHTTMTIEQIATFGSRYAQANKGAVGSVTFAAAGAPSWFVAPPGAQLYVSGGMSYASLPTTTIADVAGVIGEVRTNGLLIGIAFGTQLQDGNGAVIGNLPAGLPAGSLVLVQ